MLGIRRLGRLTFRRLYAVRLEYDSPLDYLPKRKKSSFFNWKSTSVFVAMGSYLAYSEVLLDKYAEFTEYEDEDALLPVQLTYKLTQLPIYQKLSHPQNNEKWVKLETWEDLNHNVLDKQNFTKNESKSMVSHTLAKPGGFLIKPTIFYNKEKNEGVTIIHAGYRLCGYPFIVHGGILATMLNETFKRNAALSDFTSSSYKGDFKVENLDISYKFPSFANQFLIIKTYKEDLDGEDNKTIKLRSVILSENGKTLVKANAILHDTGLVSGQGFKSYLGL